MSETTQAPDAHEIDLDIRPPLPPGKALIIMVRNRQCFNRVVDVDDAKILDPLFAEATNDAQS